MKKVIAIAVLCIGGIVAISQNLPLPPAPSSPNVFYAEWHLENGMILQIELSTNVTATIVKVKAKGQDPREMVMYETNRTVSVTKRMDGLSWIAEVQGVNVELLGSMLTTNLIADTKTNSSTKTLAIPKRSIRMLDP